MTVAEIQKHLLGRAESAEDAADGWREDGNLLMCAEYRGRAIAFREAAELLSRDLA